MSNERTIKEVYLANYGPGHPCSDPDMICTQFVVYPPDHQQSGQVMSGGKICGITCNGTLALYRGVSPDYGFELDSDGYVVCR